MEPDDNHILPYSPNSRRPHPLAMTPRTWRLLAIVCFFAALILAIIRGPTSAQIRLDTGDLRYRWYGIPIIYDRTPEPARSRLLALASTTPAIPAKWVTCVVYPLSTSNNPDLMCRTFYLNTSVWTKEDPHIARWTLDDIVDYINRTHATHGLPASCNVASIEYVDWNADRIDPTWRDNDDIKDYCARHGYTPPPRPFFRR